MKVAVFSSKGYDREFLSAANASRHQLQCFEARLSAETASLAAGFDAVCVFVNDKLDAEVIATLRALSGRFSPMGAAPRRDSRIQLYAHSRSGFIKPSGRRIR